MAVPHRPRLRRRDPAPPRGVADAAAARGRRAGAGGGCRRPAPQRVLFAARSASRPAAEAAIARMRLATGVDEDLRPFYERFAGDPMIGKAVRARPHVRIHRRAAPWEALAWSITEQLIELERALEIQRRLVRRVRPPLPALRDARHARAGADRRARAGGAAGASTSRRGARWRSATRRARSRPAASTCPTASRPGRGCGDPQHRPLDARDALALRPGPLRPRARPATSASSSSWDG